MGSSPHLRGCWKGSLSKVDRMGIQVSCKEAMLAVTAVCSFKVARQKPNNKSKQNQAEHRAVARGKEKCYSSLLFQLRVRQKCVGGCHGLAQDVEFEAHGAQMVDFIRICTMQQFCTLLLYKKGPLQRRRHFFFSLDLRLFEVVHVVLITEVTIFVLNRPDGGGETCLCRTNKQMALD